jgi:hypothetical protein
METQQTRRQRCISLITCKSKPKTPENQEFGSSDVVIGTGVTLRYLAPSHYQGDREPVRRVTRRLTEGTPFAHENTVQIAWL